MSSFEYAFLSASAAIIGIIILPYFYHFNIWKVTLFSLIISTLLSSIVLYLSFYRGNKGVSGSWGEEGIILELMNPRVLVGSLVLGGIITLILVGSILLSKK